MFQNLPHAVKIISSMELRVILHEHARSITENIYHLAMRYFQNSLGNELAENLEERIMISCIL